MSEQQQSKNDNNGAKPDGGASLDAYQRLLALATEAQGDIPTDPNIGPMDPKQREWLEMVLRESSADWDPVKQLKSKLAKLKEAVDAKEKTLPPNLEAQGEPGPSEDREEGHDDASIATMLEELRCTMGDLDLALLFCQLDGIPILRRVLECCPATSTAAPMCFSLIGELAQNNQPVQALITKENFFLNTCVDLLGNETLMRTPNERLAVGKEEVLIRCLGAVSAIVKGYIPALVKLARHHGMEAIEKCFCSAMDRGASRIAERAAITAYNICKSFTPQIAQQMKATELLESVRGKLVDTLKNDENQLSDELKEALKGALEYLSSG